MRVGVKICGVASDAAVAACVEADVDWVGFVFFPRSPRYVTPALAARLIEKLPKSVTPVGLFVAPTDEEIAQTLAEAPLGALQVYGPADRIAALARGFGLPIWSALPVSERCELPERTDAERLIVEARTPESGRPGGNGTPLDLDILVGWRSPAPWLLAGGLTVENVGNALTITGAPGVDVSSGVEGRPGVKDPRAILAFTKAARRTRAARDQ